LANALARNALFEFFRNASHTVVAHRPVTVLLEKHNLASDRQDVFGVFPESTLDVRPLAPHEGEITSGVLIGFGIRYVFLKTAAPSCSKLGCQLRVSMLFAFSKRTPKFLPHLSGDTSAASGSPFRPRTSAGRRVP
jgi:hypothetical protein